MESSGAYLGRLDLGAGTLHGFQRNVIVDIVIHPPWSAWKVTEGRCPALVECPKPAPSHGAFAMRLGYVHPSVVRLT